MCPTSFAFGCSSYSFPTSERDRLNVFAVSKEISNNQFGQAIFTKDRRFFRSQQLNPRADDLSNNVGAAWYVYGFDLAALSDKKRIGHSGPGCKDEVVSRIDKHRQRKSALQPLPKLNCPRFIEIQFWFINQKDASLR